jgi:hypothetical protein
MMTTITNFEVVTSNLPIGTLGTGAFYESSIKFKSSCGNNQANPGLRNTILNVGGITRTHSVTIDKTNVLAQTVQYV